jgi:hypothetical protein
MPQIKIEPFDPMRHGNPMWYIDDAQRKRYWKSPTLTDYKVCLVTVCSFTFIFHSTEQIEMCLGYYRAEHHPSSRLPVYTENLGGDHSETQRWFEKLPQYLLEKPKRLKVVNALEKALREYSQVTSAKTGTKPNPVYNWNWRYSKNPP